MVTRVTKEEALLELLRITRVLLKEACSCDLLYGIHCGIHSYGIRIDQLEQTLKEKVL